jgi:hypothetical protein
MKNILLILLILISNYNIAQTSQETIDWIGRNSNGREQLFFDKNEGILFLISVRGDYNEALFVHEIIAKDVQSVSFKLGKNGWNSLYLNFIHSGSYVKSYTIDSNFNKTSEVNNTHQYAVQISLPVDESLIKSFKKAFIHLFNTLGYHIKDGDMF